MTDIQDKTRIGAAADAAKSGAATALDQAGKFAHAQAEAATDAVTGRAGRQAEEAAAAARAAAREFEQGSLQAQAAEHISAGLNDVAERLRHTDFDAAARRVTGFARENPALFLGGAALLGFAAARFLKASEPRPRAIADRSDDPWMGHVSATPRHAVPGAPAYGASRASAPAPSGSGQEVS